MPEGMFFLIFPLNSFFKALTIVYASSAEYKYVIFIERGGCQNLFLELAHREESGHGREGGWKGIAEYLETKLGGFSIYCIESAGGEYAPRDPWRLR